MQTEMKTNTHAPIRITHDILIHNLSEYRDFIVTFHNDFLFIGD